MCVVSEQNHLWNCGQAKGQSLEAEVAMTEKTAFPDTGVLLTQIPSANIFF